MRRHALVAGATGLVGHSLVQLLLDDADTMSVVALTRRPLAIPHPKLVEAEVDFAHLSDCVLPEVDDYYCCLGTTIRQAGSRDAFREVDLEYAVTIARMALAAGATRCYVVSALGANPSSRVFYNRVKGEVEVELGRLPFRTVVAFRPSLLMGERTHGRAGERAALAVARPRTRAAVALSPDRRRHGGARHAGLREDGCGGALRRRVGRDPHVRGGRGAGRRGHLTPHATGASGGRGRGQPIPRIRGGP